MSRLASRLHRGYIEAKHRGVEAGAQRRGRAGVYIAGMTVAMSATMYVHRLSIVRSRRRFDSVIRVTRTAGDGRKEGAKHIQTYSSTVWINLDISRHPRRADCGFKREDRFAG